MGVFTMGKNRLKEHIIFVLGACNLRSKMLFSTESVSFQGLLEWAAIDTDDVCKTLLSNKCTVT